MTQSRYCKIISKVALKTANSEMRCVKKPWVVLVLYQGRELYYIVNSYKRGGAHLITSPVWPVEMSPPNTLMQFWVSVSQSLQVWSSELVTMRSSWVGIYLQHERYPVWPVSEPDTGRFPSLSGAELRLKTEQTLSRPPHATALPPGEMAAAMTQAHANLKACVFWPEMAFHTMSLPSCDADTIREVSRYDQSSEYICSNTILQDSVLVGLMEHSKPLGMVDSQNFRLGLLPKRNDLTSCPVTQD